MTRTVPSALLTAALSAATLAVLVVPSQPAAAATTKRCPSFIVFRGDGFVYPATNVRFKGSVSCSKVKRMIKSTYGGPGAYRVSRPSVGRPTYYWKGGWRCGNGAGGAGCTNTRHSSWTITANVGYRDN